jgi:hypothetical protein
VTLLQRAAGAFAVFTLVLASCSSGFLVSYDMKPRDCFNDSQTARQPTVDCDQPHDKEVFAAFVLDGDRAFPGNEVLYDEMFAVCDPLFESYVGSPFEASGLHWGSQIPLRQLWADGDRRALCFLYDRDPEKLTRSMRNSGE